MTSTATKPTAVTRCYTYAHDVVEGRITAGRKVKLACSRFLADLDKQADPKYPWRFDEAKAEHPCGFMEKFLTPTKGDYDCMELMPWQCFVEGNLYGWVSKKTGYRRFREGLVIVGTGNGKSTLLAGNATYGACKDGERGAEVYLLANSKEQAGIVFEECNAQIKASKALRSRFRPLRDGVYYDAMNAKIKARASDSKKLDGLNPHLGIFDEIHEYRDFKLINVIKRKIVKRLQAMIIYITTMGNVIDGPLAYFYGLFTDAMEGKLAARVADRLFAYIAELDEDDDPEDTSTWIKANPSLGVLLSLEDLKDQWDRCKLIPSERADFICKQLNIMVNADDMQYVQPEVTKRNNKTIDLETLKGRRCYGGFDLSNREDFTAAALEFPLDDGRVFILLHSWVPERKVLMDQEKIDYHHLALTGHLSIVKGEYVEQMDVYKWFLERTKDFEIVTIGYDPANATRLVQMLEGKGFDCEVVRQGPLTLNDPMKDMKELLLDGNVVTNNDPMFAWYTDNVKISGERRHTDKDNWMPTKRNRFRKIDGFMAALDAHCIRMRKNPAGIEQRKPDIRVLTLPPRTRTRRSRYDRI